MPLVEGEQAEDGGVYMMYHGTTPERAALIEQGGFKASTQGLLGPGVYVSRDVRQSRMYGSTILEVRVRVGRVCRADRHPELIPRGYGTEAPWHDVGGYDTAWVPPDCPATIFEGCELFDGVGEEFCVWEACRVSVLGRAEDDGDDGLQTIEWSFEQRSAGAGGSGVTSATKGWVAFSPAGSRMIESHYLAWQSKGRAGAVVVVFGDGPRNVIGKRTGDRREMRFDKMVERSLRTGVERQIRRGLSERGAAAILQAHARQAACRRLFARVPPALVVVQKTFRGHLCRRRQRLGFV